MNGNGAAFGQQHLTGQPALDRLHADVQQLAYALGRRARADEYGGRIDVKGLAQLTLSVTAAALIEFDGQLITDRTANHIPEAAALPEDGWAAVVRATLPSGIVDLSVMVDPAEVVPNLHHKATEVQRIGKLGTALDQFNVVFTAAMQPALASSRATPL
ncbi:hypothetical protein [Curtobacterium sp. MCSS17_016]|uniref:hypothetical protein n=1 Tax=Curtobacterium sp. MCSS17_016 TaxID=2175644 RepID=UPI000DA761BB|nr:hypothetical protein [Curtobacterium sp. MCSS17_016]WIE81446.1 hypothetical protein DEJ19_019615 [Curtobacterium sp. MCSS17_016]